MRWLDLVRLRLRALFAREGQELSLDDEMRFHLEEMIRANVSRGMSPDDARAAAMREFGPAEVLKEECRDTRGVQWIENFVRDLRHGLRSLRMNPGFAAAVILSLGLGLGGATAVFRVVEAVLLRPLPAADPDRLRTVEVEVQGTHNGMTLQDLARVAKTQRSFAGWYLATGRFHVRLHIGDRAADQVPVNQVTHGFFEVLGLRPAAGRFFVREDDEVPDSAKTLGSVAVISHDLWMREFNGAQQAVGSKIGVNQTQCTVVGVAPAGFQGDATGERVDVWTPVVPFHAREPVDGVRDIYGMQMIRLLAGVTTEQAETDMTAIYRQIQAARPKQTFFVRRNEAAGWQRLEAEPHDYKVKLGEGRLGFDILRERYERPLQLMLGATLLVFLIGCANVASLLLSRGVARREEFAVRAALGAGRSRLVFQVLTECLLLAVAASVTGLLLGSAGGALLVSLVDSGVSPGLTIASGWRLVAFLSALTCGSVLLFGLAPALRQSRGPTAMRGRGAAGKGQRIHHGLVVAQVAMSVALLAAAMQLGRTISNLRMQDFGFEISQVVSASYWLDSDKASVEHARETGALLLDRISEMPGVRSAALSSAGFFGSQDLFFTIGVPGDERQRPGARADFVSPRYFETMGVPLLAGRGFQAREDVPVAVVNEAFVNKVMLGVDPLNMAVTVGSFRNVRIVGIVKNARYRNARIDFEAAIFLPHTMSNRAPTRLDARVAGDPAAFASGLRAAMQAADRDVVVDSVRTMRSNIDRSFQREMALAKLVGVFALFALVLAVGGLYGLMSYAVSRRANEFGIRMALGARPGQVLALVMRDSGLLIALGVAVGVPCAMAGSRLLKAFLFGVESDEPWSYAASTGALAAVGLLAALLPARRAAGVDPASVLRLE